ncbi:MAG: AraC family transcriptional regulator [Clostridiales bacterium]|nr:AraC family transcriptional regulator [Clostridiales bacterium]
MKREQMGLIVKRDDGSEIVNYDDPSFPSYIYDGWIAPHVTWERVPHYHQDIEMLAVKSGKMAYSVDGKTILLNAGDTIFVNANRIHYSICVDDTTAKYVIFVADPAILNSSVAVQMQALLPILDNPELSYIRFRDINENTEDIFDLMMKLPDIKHDPFQITKTFYSIWEILLAQSKTIGFVEAENKSDTYKSSFKQMMYFIQQNFREPINLDAIAGSGNVSKSLCNKIFNQYVGESPVNYVLHFRVRKVAEYLRNSSYSLSQIADLTGFNGVSYMSETFKKNFGQSPRDYRKAWATGTATA